jgi:hypothetical protein
VWRRDPPGAIVGSVKASFAGKNFGLFRLQALAIEVVNRRFQGLEPFTQFHPIGGGRGLSARQVGLLLFGTKRFVELVTTLCSLL